MRIPAADTAQLPLPPPHRHVKYDLSSGESLWVELMHWLAAHLPHLAHGEDARLDAARERLERREEALRLARENPRLALEAGVGRPDLPDAYDGGLVDLNHAPAEAIASLPGLDAARASEMVSARERIDGFVSLEDLGAVLDLPADTVERLRERVVFLPR